MNCPKCDGETKEAADVDNARDEVIELGWFYCAGTESQKSCGWNSEHDQAREDSLEREVGWL